MSAYDADLAQVTIRARPPGMSPEVVEPPPQAPVAEIESAYVVVVVSSYGTPRRRVYLSLHHATAAIQRAEKKGQAAGLVLCRLVPIAADLDLDGGWTE